MGDSKNKIRSFRVRARQQAGYQLRRVQQGLLPSDWKSMLGVGQARKTDRHDLEMARKAYREVLNLRRGK
ncbi:MAG: hypothetical protein HYY44_01230 [Deltaproteobacteria bacterium]|nr:hypothetical protein [Deltaproteobacteria bacterium]